MRRNVLLVGVVVAAVISGLLSEGASRSAEAHTISNVRLVSQDTGKCLDVVGGAGPQTHLWSCVGVSWQNWDIVHYSGEWHYIKNKKPGTNFCLGVPGGLSGDIQLQWYTCNFTAAQLFKVPACSLCFAEIRNMASNKCVDVQWSAVGDGTVIWQYTCNGTRAQQWAPDNHNIEKRKYTDRWYQFYEDSYNYATWLTHYDTSACRLVRHQLERSNWQRNECVEQSRAVSEHCVSGGDVSAIGPTRRSRGSHERLLYGLRRWQVLPGAWYHLLV